MVDGTAALEEIVSDEQVREALDAVRKLDPFNNSAYRITDDLTKGIIFADAFKDKARYNLTANAWYFYDGIAWCKDSKDGTRVFRLMQDFTRAMMVYAADALEMNDNERMKFVMSMQTVPARQKIIKDAQARYPFTSDELDRNGDLLNCINGVLNLRTGELLPHSPDLMLSMVANVLYDKTATAPRWYSFIDEVMQCDKSKADYLQRLMGYCLTTDTSREECYILYGASSRNGKSTLMDTVCYMLGDYSRNIEPETLAQRKKDGSAASGDLSRLKGCRLLHCGEPPKGMHFSVELLKKMTGRDVITARGLYQDFMQFTPVFKLIFNTNYLPQVNDDTLFASGRVKVIEFSRHFTKAEQDDKLKDLLKQPANLSGILNWCIAGLHRYRTDGLSEPPAVEDATERYKHSQDKTQNFLDECLEPYAGGIVKLKDLYAAYAAWNKSNGYYCEGKKSFSQMLQTKGILCDDSVLHWVVRDYKIADDCMPDVLRSTGF